MLTVFCYGQVYHLRATVEFLWHTTATTLWHVYIVSLSRPPTRNQCNVDLRSLRRITKTGDARHSFRCSFEFYYPQCVCSPFVLNYLTEKQAYNSSIPLSSALSVSSHPSLSALVRVFLYILLTVFMSCHQNQAARWIVDNSLCHST